MNKIKLIIANILLVASFSGCATYNDKSAPFVKKWKSGDLEGSFKGFSGLSDKARKKDKVIYSLEAGAVARSLGDLDSSNLNFEISQNTIDEYESKAQVSISGETASMFSNQAALPYRGGIVDKIMLDTYQGLNYWEKGDLDRARNEFISLMVRQDEAQSLLNEISDDSYSYDQRALVEKAKNDYALSNQIRDTQTFIADLEGYDKFMNPYSEFIYGMFFMNNALDASDLDKALKAMERTNSLIEGNEDLQSNIAEMNQLLAGKSELSKSTHIIFETGTAPRRTQTKIDIPLFLVSNKVPYVGAAFPKLELNEDCETDLRCISNDVEYKSSTIASIDRMVAAEFKKGLPRVITKTIISTVVKAYTAYLAQEAARKQYESDLQKGKDTTASQMLLLFTQIGGTVWQVAVNNADLRTWNTLPKEVQYVKIETPSSKMIEVKLGDKSYPIQLLNDRNFIIIKSNSQGMDPIIKQIKI